MHEADFIDACAIRIDRTFDAFVLRTKQISGTIGLLFAFIGTLFVFADHARKAVVIIGTCRRTFVFFAVFGRCAVGIFDAFRLALLGFAHEIACTVGIGCTLGNAFILFAHENAIAIVFFVALNAGIDAVVVIAIQTICTVVVDDAPRRIGHTGVNLTHKTLFTVVVGCACWNALLLAADKTFVAVFFGFAFDLTAMVCTNFIAVAVAILLAFVNTLAVFADAVAIAVAVRMAFGHTCAVFADERFVAIVG